MKITAFIFLMGDRSVGIMDGEINMDFGEWSSYTTFFDTYDGGREAFRKGLMEYAETWFDANKNSYVIFGDECPDCGKILDVLGQPCKNKYCISNNEEEYVNHETIIG